MHQWQEETIIIFTDAATSSKDKIAVGGFLNLDRKLMDQYVGKSAEALAAKFSEGIVYKKFKSKKSTWSEIKTAIAALYSVLQKSGPGRNVEIYTDCQSLCDLMSRRKEKLEKNNFVTRSGKVLANADLYKELFAITDKFKIKTFKIKGHAKIAHRLTSYEKIFAILDKLTRQKLRSILNTPKISKK